MSTPEVVQRRVVIRGLVQGVFFRYSTRQVAEELGLRGWVRNCRDGTVEALFQGTSAAVEAAVAWCRRGPPGARVDAVEVTEQPASSALRSFSIELTR